MANSEEIPHHLKDLIDDYLQGLLDDVRTRELEQILTSDPAARAYFVRYSRLHTDLHIEMRALNAGQRALGKIEAYSRQGRQQTRPTSHQRSLSSALYKAGLLV